MCGISGYLDLDAGVRTDLLQKMNDVIRHRGPDDEGYRLIGQEQALVCGGTDTIPQIKAVPLWEVEGSPYFLGLGHRRLSIIDLTDSGHQPMTLEDRKITLVYNGEIYNYLELRAELESLGYTFKTSSDTEVLLYAYSQWGEDCLNHFNGMWGFALWDGNAHKLFCARDRMGAKPFHYWRSGNKLLFGSELKQLCQDTSVPKQFNRTYLAATLIYKMSDFDDQTWIENFHALRPGHKLVVQLSADCRKIDAFRVSPYWELTASFRRDLSAQEWRERVAEEFSRSCRWRLRSDAPIAALLSGGLDSSCMVTEMCAQMADPSQLHTFTSRFPAKPGERECDEWTFADMVNRHCGCQGNPVLLNPQGDIQSLYETAVWHGEGPVGIATVGPKLLFEELHRRGFKVILNGQCGDETMFGYDWYYARYLMDLLQTGHPVAMIRSFTDTVHHSALTTKQLLEGIVYYNIPFVRDLRKSACAKRFLDRSVLAEKHWERLHPLLCPPSCQELQIKGLTSITLPGIVRMDDRMYMSCSIESRLPFMDYRFVELAIQIPPELKIKNGYTKYIMREVFDGRMPKEVTWRKDKKGFAMPKIAWAKRFSREYLEDYIHSAQTAPYFQMDYLKSLVRTAPESPEIFDFLNVELFAREFRVQ